MDVRILDLDGGVRVQRGFVRRYRPALLDASHWGPKIRLGCGFGRFRRFERDLAESISSADQTDSTITFVGSGDFHHVSLALLRRIREPFNLLILDNHPDWMRGVPFLHCGTWVYHALRLPHLKYVFHVGGDVDFDNYYRWLAPWRRLRDGQIVVLPAIRSFQRGRWSSIGNASVRLKPEQTAPSDHLETLVEQHRHDLAQRPLYISLDKDVMPSTEAVVNWDSGHLRLAEVQRLLALFLECAGGNLIGMDVVGDWSPVRLRGLLRRFLHWTEHPRLEINLAEATARNELTNLMLLETVQKTAIPAIRQAKASA
jgi:hypothetical protein